ncbi:MAG: excinuclease ABC subunit C [Bdellovibrionales bacterium RBG_16_40_8]|nr:MAG: excinuclease ABC subunit C [Bdellovibrionales bacterium RBG_16_40_8]
MSARRDELKQRVKELPSDPGVYLMKSSGDKIIYVGKAKDLRSRVRSYFQDAKNVSVKTQHLAAQIYQIDYLITKTEVEAYLLEASLIKKHRPRYNIRLKDDKSYPYIRCSMGDDFPRFYLFRKVKSDGAYYFGPYTSGLYVRDTIRFLNRTFKIRDCTDGFMKTRKRPCITHQIGRCTAPCVKYVSREDYSIDVGGALDFLRGRNKKVILELNKKMKEAAKSERFEAAAKLRDSITAIEAILEKQIVVSQKSEIDQDVIAFVGDERGTLVETLHIRAGRVIGNRSQFLPRLNAQSADEDPKEWLTSFINQYYSENIVPDQIILPIDLTDDIYRLLREVFSERKQTRAQFIHAHDREQKKLIEMAEKNAKSHFADHVNRQTNITRILEEIQSAFQLRALPQRIECFDISNFQGDESVASQVVYEDGLPKRRDYRRYKIRTVKGANDFASIKEVLERRFKHTEYDDPQLVVIDGGKGQLNIALKALKEIDRDDIQCVGMAKARSEGEFTDVEASHTEERFFLPGRSNPVIFRATSEALKVLIALRDEAHRFAIEYHRKLRGDKMLQSRLDNIQGLGEKRKLALLKYFGSVEGVALANIEEIALVSGMTKKLAEKVKTFLNNATNCEPSTQL